jgi:hypothetical protein
MLFSFNGFPGSPMIRPLLRRPIGSRLLTMSLASLLTLVIAPAQAQQQRPAAQPAKPAAAAKPAATPAKPAAAPAQPAATQAKPAPGGTAQRPGAAAPTTGAKPAAPAAGPGGASAVLVATFADWGVYTAPAGRSKICYALTQPKDRQPKNLTRDPAFLFVSFRPAENVRNEVALVMGFPTKEDGPAEASIGTASYALLTKEQNAWLKNPAEEGQAIATMSKGQNITVKAQSRRGNQLTDRYSLNGFGQALERARRECTGT